MPPHANIASRVFEVFENQSLDLRPISPPAHEEEKNALLELAGRMHDDPGGMLPKFVELAMKLTGGISAGISLLEDAQPPVFRWHHLKGLLSPFEGATTPRDFSPCGITLDRRRPTLAVHPERVYDWIPRNLSLPEVLLVPLFVGRTDPLGTLWIVSDKPGHFNGGHSRTMQELATFIGLALKMMRSEQELQAALEQQETLTKEMSHRLKNMFTVVDAMIRISSRRTTNKEDMERMLSGRLHALATAHSLVRRGFSEVQGTASDLADILRLVVQPHEIVNDAGIGRFTFSGPSILCGEQAINGLALIFHELATNSSKYGALGEEAGRVEVLWREDNGNLKLVWSELGGSAPQVSPSRQGFGSVLVDATVLRQFHGQLEYDWAKAGLRIEMTLPIAKLEN